MYRNGIFNDQPRNLSYIRQLFFIEVGSGQEDGFSTGIENDSTIRFYYFGRVLVL